MAQKKRCAKVNAGKKKTLTKFHEYSAANDIKYRGPLNYQSFQLFGWICIILSVVAAIISLGSSISPDLEKDLGKLGNILSLIASCSLPFLLMANFSKILANKEGYGKQLFCQTGSCEISEIQKGQCAAHCPVSTDVPNVMDLFPNGKIREAGGVFCQ